MDLAAIRTAVRSLIKETQTETGTLFPSDNVLLDFYINLAMEYVVLDLAHFLPNNFLLAENISLVASTSAYSLTATPLRILAVLRNETNESQQQVPEVKIWDFSRVQTKGETYEFPKGWYLTGEKTMNFIPIPSTAKANGVTVWMIAREAASMASGGPVYIPTGAHYLIPVKACYFICVMNAADTRGFERMYGDLFQKVIMIYGNRNQGEPRFLGGSFFDTRFASTRDITTYDVWDPLGGGS